jgi:hypothetical protein
MVFTALGDAVNVAARLQEMTKSLACEAIVSEEVRITAGIAAETLPAREVAIRGRSEPMTVRYIVHAKDLSAQAGAPDGRRVESAFRSTRFPWTGLERWQLLCETSGHDVVRLSPAQCERLRVIADFQASDPDSPVASRGRAFNPAARPQNSSKVGSYMRFPVRREPRLAVP